MQRLAAIKLLICDVDGVLTDGSLYYTEQGETMKMFHVHDGLGLKMLMNQGIQVAILSGGDTPVLRKRLAHLGIPLMILGKMEKRSACFDLMAQAGVTAEQTAYIGDDCLDLPAFEVCGVAVATGDAFDYVKAKADLVMTKSGGRGVVRELTDHILRAHGKAEIFETADGFLKVATQMAQ